MSDATRFHWIVAALLISGFPAPAVEARPHPCEVRGVPGEALCATLPVWENREARTGRRIDLNIVILRALQKDHAADPLFLLHGGPGAAATALAPAYARHPLRERRDIVMVDQRGTGGSHALPCDFYGDPPDLQRLVTSQFPVEQVRACREQLEKNADLAQYTTAIAMDDVDEVRQWLGYAKINLWGGSYGSLAAQVYLRRHEASVRAVVLEGVLPADELAVLHHASAGQRAIDILLDRCHVEASCNSDYPQLREDFASMFQLVRQGAEVEVRDEDGRTARVRPGVEALAEGIRHRLYSDTGKALAGMVHRAAKGNLGRWCRQRWTRNWHWIANSPWGCCSRSLARSIFSTSRTKWPPPRRRGHSSAICESAISRRRAHNGCAGRCRRMSTP